MQKQQALNVLQQELAAMTASAQGITRQFLELRAKESNLTADLAGREADLRGLETSLQENGQRMEQLRADLQSGKDRQQQAQENLNACRKELANAQEEVTAANNTINGYETDAYLIIIIKNGDAVSWQTMICSFPALSETTM